MEDESIEASFDFEELDEDLTQELEDLGKVLDELSGDGEDFDLSQELEAADSTADKSETPAKITSLVTKKKDGASSPDNESSVKAQSLNEEELEEGEILEADERNELKELHKKKTEIVNKMKKLVRHKMQLTTQRNDLLLQLQNNTQLDKVNTLLKENSLLVKAISNQIFRMNPEIKIINGKIKELEISIGSETYDKDQNPEVPISKVSASKKDIENIENFFDKLSGAIKSKKEKVSKNDNVDKNSGKLSQSKVSIDSTKLKQVSKLYLNRTTVKAMPDSTSKNTEKEPALGFKKMPRLISDNSKIKKIFERVCEMTENEQKSSASASENVANPLEKKLSSSFEYEEESENTLSDAKIIDVSVAKTIDMKLKEIRMKTLIPKTQLDVKVVDLTDGKPQLVDLTDGSPNAKQGTDKLLDKKDGDTLPNKVEKHEKKRKQFDETDSDSPNSCDVKKIKTFENTVACGISKSLLQRLGSTPEGSIRRSSVSIDNADNMKSDELYTDVSQETRNSFWCQYCSCVFKSPHMYITHLESEKHLRTAMAKQGSRISNLTKDDASAAKASHYSEDIDAWCKGTSKVQDKNSYVGANSCAEEDFCIAVVGTDEFCKKKKIGFSHTRCFVHAKCLIRSKEIPVNYSPHLCSVCMEYLTHSHSSLKCCEKIFRIFKFFRKRFGLSFDWENKPLKDWFFDNYRNIQGVSPENVVDASGKSITVSYEDFRAEQELFDKKTQHREDGDGVTSGKCLAKKDASTCTDDETVVSGDSKLNLHTSLDHNQNDGCGKLPSPL